MDEIINNFSSVSWWFSVVVVGIIVSIIGNYSKSAIDFTVNYALNRLSNLRKKNEQATKEAIEKLNSDSDFRDFIFQGEMRAYTSSIALAIAGALGFGMFILMFYSPSLSSIRHLARFVGFGCMVCLLLSAKEFMRGAYLGHGLIIAAKDRFKLK